MAEANRKEHEAVGDDDAAKFWVRVGIEVKALLDARLSLAAILEGSTTKLMMKADGVTREHINAVMTDAKRARDSMTEALPKR